jgi:hypothetical protein
MLIMVNWVLIIVAIVAIAVVSKFIHFRHWKHRITAIFLILLLLFIGLTFMKVYTNNSLDLKTPSGLFSAAKIYFAWLVHIFDNVKVLTGNAVRMDWSGNLTR